MLFVYVSKTDDETQWCVKTADHFREPLETVYVSDRKRDCVEFARQLAHEESQKGGSSGN